MGRSLTWIDPRVSRVQRAPAQWFLQNTAANRGPGETGSPVTVDMHAVTVDTSEVGRLRRGIAIDRGRYSWPLRVVSDTSYARDAWRQPLGAERLL